MSKYKFGYDNGGKNKDLQCVNLYNNETKEISLFFKPEDIARQKDARIAELEKQLAEKDKLLENAIVPKFNKGQNIYIFEKFNNEVIKGEIDMFNYYTEKYLVFVDDNFGSDWYLEDELYAIKKEALKET